MKIFRNRRAVVRVAAVVVAGTGYALDERGNLVVFAPTGTAFTEGRTANYDSMVARSTHPLST